MPEGFLQSMLMRSDRFQDLLAALYVSYRERREWNLNSGFVERCYGLDEAARAALRGLGNNALEFYAGQLQKKRFSEIMKFIPLAGSRYREALWENFNRYVHDYVPIGPKKHIGDAIAFGRFFCSGGDEVPPEALSLLRFELVPWELNFRLEEKRVALPASGTALRLIRASRAFGLRCQMKRFRGYIPAIIDGSENAAPAEAREGHVGIDSVGLFLKPPLISQHLEWYVPIRRKIRGSAVLDGETAHS